MGGIRLNRRRRLLAVGGAASYTTFIESLLGSAIISHLPLDETSGAVAADASGNSRTGAYTGVTLNSTTFGGKPAGLWDGTNDYVDWYTASLASAFDGAEFSILLWGRVSSAGVWTDGIDRRLIYFDGALTNQNRVIIQKSSGANQMLGYVQCGNVAKSVSVSTTTTDWFSFVVTNSASADQMKVFFNGTQSGTTQTGLGTWAGPLDSTHANIGATEQTPTLVMDGNITQVVILNRVATPAEITSFHNGVTP